MIHETHLAGARANSNISCIFFGAREKQKGLKTIPRATWMYMYVIIIFNCLLSLFQKEVFDGACHQRRPLLTLYQAQMQALERMGTHAIMMTQCSLAHSI